MRQTNIRLFIYTLIAIASSPAIAHHNQNDFLVDHGIRSLPDIEDLQARDQSLHVLYQRDLEDFFDDTPPNFRLEPRAYFVDFVQGKMKCPACDATFTVPQDPQVVWFQCPTCGTQYKMGFAQPDSRKGACLMTPSGRYWPLGHPQPDYRGCHGVSPPSGSKRKSPSSGNKKGSPLAGGSGSSKRKNKRSASEGATGFQVYSGPLP